MRAVDQHLGGRATRCRQRLEHGAPHALGGPADIAVVERLGRTVDRRRIPPPTPRLSSGPKPIRRNVRFRPIADTRVMAGLRPYRPFLEEYADLRSGRKLARYPSGDGVGACLETRTTEGINGHACAKITFEARLFLRTQLTGGMRHSNRDLN